MVYNSSVIKINKLGGLNMLLERLMNWAVHVANLLLLFYIAYITECCHCSLTCCVPSRRADHLVDPAVMITVTDFIVNMI
jgi:Na+-translocating ferredoxin:NAD+ oxidoreductase RnfD subunit